MSFSTLIDCETLAARLNENNWRIFDCRFDLADTRRGERAYAAGHIPGSFYAHLDRDLAGPISPRSGRHPLPEIADLSAWLGARGVSRDTQVIAYDDTGGTMAVRLWWLLRWLGHRQVALLDGGLPSWVNAGLPLQTDPPPTPPQREFHAAPDPAQVVTSDEIADQLNAGEHRLLLLDARTGERYRGEAEPIDPVAGHIPGAVNLTLQDNLNDDGRFKSPAALRALYERALAGHPAGDTAVMCGSGVTACHNLLAMELAGLTGGRLYAGSWSEWIRDPGRPVATGP
jgi:thiosulfate/3-mercaptopyruvate sulfurtransferase